MQFLVLQIYSGLSSSGKLISTSHRSSFSLVQQIDIDGLSTDPISLLPRSPAYAIELLDIIMSEPTVVPSSTVLPTTANGTSTPVFIQRASQGAGGAGGTFGVKTGLAQMLKGG